MRKIFFFFKNQDGFTLAEVLIALFIFALIMGIVPQSILNSGMYYQYVVTKSDAVQNARIALLRIADEAREAEVISTNGGHQLIFQKDEGGETIRYYLNGNQLQRNQNVVAYGIQQLNFQRSGRMLTIEIKSGDYPLKTSVYLRNVKQ
jgi:prepilin-type N-terminal cleavage/methylation domain-containing protein